MKNIIIRGNNISYKDINQQHNQVILLVHGHPFTHSMWKYQYDALSNFRLIIPDLRGYGRSDYNFENIYIEEQAMDLASLLNKLNIEKIHLVGLSMGGQIIVEFQRLFPERVLSLVICASTPFAETKESYTIRLKLAEKINEIGMLQYTKNHIHEYINLKAVGNNSKVYKHLFKMMSQTKTIGAVASHKGRAERRDNFIHLKNINIPTLVIAGEEDFFFKVEGIKKVANEIPGAQFSLIDKSGHLPNMEKPEIFNDIIKDFYQL